MTHNLEVWSGVDTLVSKRECISARDIGSILLRLKILSELSSNLSSKSKETC